MSWHYLQGQEAAYWAEKSLDGAPAALLKLIPTPERYCSRDRQTECLKSSQFGTTSEPLTEDLGDRQLTLFPVGSPVKILAQQVKVADLPESVLGYGLKCCELLARLDLVLSSRKTLRTCVPVDSAPSSRDLPAWGMTFDGACWELGTSVRLINGIESGSLLPTPTAQQFGSNQGGAGGRVGKVRLSLSGMAAQNKWPTPKAQDAKNNGPPSEANRNTPSLAYQIGGPLNPTWVEWLMGWPIGWTDLEPLETDRFQEWQRKHSQSYLTDGHKEALL